jgi:hypothetical protein
MEVERVRVSFRAHVHAIALDSILFALATSSSRRRCCRRRCCRRRCHGCILPMTVSSLLAKEAVCLRRRPPLPLLRTFPQLVRVGSVMMVRQCASRGPAQTHWSGTFIPVAVPAVVISETAAVIGIHILIFLPVDAVARTWRTLFVDSFESVEPTAYGPLGVGTLTCCP